MGRRQINFESMTARFPDGTIDRIDKVLRKGESKARFICNAVVTKLEARERGRKPSLKPVLTKAREREAAPKWDVWFDGTAITSKYQ